MQNWRCRNVYALFIYANFIQISSVNVTQTDFLRKQKQTENSPSVVWKYLCCCPLCHLIRKLNYHIDMLKCELRIVNKLICLIEDASMPFESFQQLNFKSVFLLIIIVAEILLDRKKSIIFSVVSMKPEDLCLDFTNCIEFWLNFHTTSKIQFQFYHKHTI